MMCAKLFEFDEEVVVSNFWSTLQQQILYLVSYGNSCHYGNFLYETSYE